MANNTGKKFGGRKKGTPNKDIKEIKDVFQILIENNLGNMNDWINELAKKNPEKAINTILKLSEYILPKVSAQKNIEKEVDLYDNLTLEELKEEIKKIDNLYNYDDL